MRFRENTHLINTSTMSVVLLERYTPFDAVVQMADSTTTIPLERFAKLPYEQLPEVGAPVRRMGSSSSGDAVARYVMSNNTVVLDTQETIPISTFFRDYETVMMSPRPYL
jgi:hypothetical protein